MLRALLTTDLKLYESKWVNDTKWEGRQTNKQIPVPRDAVGFARHLKNVVDGRCVATLPASTCNGAGVSLCWWRRVTRTLLPSLRSNTCIVIEGNYAYSYNSTCILLRVFCYVRLSWKNTLVLTNIHRCRKKSVFHL